MKRGCLITIAALALLLVGGIIVDRLIPSAAMRSLPKSATHKQEYFQGLNDYVRLIKASLPQEDYEEYARNLGFEARYEKDNPNASYANLGHGDAPEWWDPPRADETTYFEYEPEWARFLKFENGVVYYMDCSW